MILSSVDFPQPDGPSRQTNSPSSIRRLISTSADVSEPCEMYFLWRFSAVSIDTHSLQLFVTGIAGVAVRQAVIDYVFVGHRLLNQTVLLHPAHQRIDPGTRRLVILPAATVVGLLQERHIDIRGVVFQHLESDLPVRPHQMNRVEMRPYEPLGEFRMLLDELAG